MMFEKELVINAQSNDYEKNVSILYDNSNEDDKIGGELKFAINGRYDKAPILSNVADPTKALDASNKRYVDTAVAALEARIAALEAAASSTTNNES